MSAPRRIDGALLAEARRLISDEGLSQTAAAERLGVSQSGLSVALRRESRGLQPERLEVRGDGATIDSYDLDALADADALLRRRGLDPDEWEVTGASVTEWGRDPETGEPYQRLKIVLKRRRSAATLLVPEPVKPVRPPRVRRSTSRPRVGFIASDFHAPFHEGPLLATFLRFLEDVQPEFGILAGDVIDLPEPSRHARNPAFHATPQECVRSGFADVLAPVRERVPDAELDFIIGNHDARIRRWLLAEQPSLADLCPGDGEVPALSMRNLLALDKLHIRAVEPVGEYADGQVVVCRNLAVIHGERTGKNAGDAELQTYGHSLAFGHTHRKESIYRTLWKFDGASVHTAVNVGCMCRVDGGLGYVRRPNWQQGFGVVTVWPDGAFSIEHANYVNGSLLWRDRRWSA